jgi:hypothetical protein
MPVTPYEYILMASSAYENPEREKRNIELLKKFSDGWENSNTLTAAESVRIQVFINDNKKQIVLAFRGTELNDSGAFLETFLTNIKTVLGGNFHGHYTNATNLVFSDYVVGYLKKGYQLSFTGHSLGGFLAEGAADLCACEELCNQLIPSSFKQENPVVLEKILKILSEVSAVTFDSPGFGNGREWRRKSNGPLNVTSFKFLISPINTVLLPINDHMVYGLTPKLKDIPSGYFERLFFIHSIEKYINCFDKETGFPKENEWYRVAQWPQISPDKIDKLLDPRNFTRGDGSINPIWLLRPFFISAQELMISSLDKYKTIQDIKTQLAKVELASLISSEDIKQVLDVLVNCGHLLKENRHDNLMRCMSLDIFPKKIGLFLQEYYAIKLLKNVIKKFHKKYKLSEAEVNFLADFEIKGSDIIVGSGSVFVFKNRLIKFLQDKEGRFFKPKNFAEERFDEMLGGGEVMTVSEKKIQKQWDKYRYNELARLVAEIKQKLSKIIGDGHSALEVTNELDKIEGDINEHFSLSSHLEKCFKEDSNSLLRLIKKMEIKCLVFSGEVYSIKKLARDIKEVRYISYEPDLKTFKYSDRKTPFILESVNVSDSNGSFYLKSYDHKKYMNYQSDRALELSDLPKDSWYLYRVKNDGIYFLCLNHNKLMLSEDKSYPLAGSQNTANHAQIVFETTQYKSWQERVMKLSRLEEKDIHMYDQTVLKKEDTKMPVDNPLTPAENNEVTLFLDRILPRLMPAQNRSLVYVIGNVGAGKSTFINKVIGHGFVEIDGDEGGYLNVVDQQRPYAEMGSALGVAQTVYPAIYGHDGRAYVDCPGFNEPGLNREIANYRNQFSIFLSKEMAQSIRSVIVVISTEEMGAARGAAFLQLYTALHYIIPIHLLPALRNNIIFVFNNKGSRAYTRSDQVLRAINGYKELLISERNQDDVIIRQMAGTEYWSEVQQRVYEEREKDLVMLGAIQQQNTVLWKDYQNNSVPDSIYQLLAANNSGIDHGYLVFDIQPFKNILIKWLSEQQERLQGLLNHKSSIERDLQGITALTGSLDIIVNRLNEFSKIAEAHKATLEDYANIVEHENIYIGDNETGFTFAYSVVDCSGSFVDAIHEANQNGRVSQNVGLLPLFQFNRRDNQVINIAKLDDNDTAYDNQSKGWLDSSSVEIILNRTFTIYSRYRTVYQSMHMFGSIPRHHVGCLRGLKINAPNERGNVLSLKNNISEFYKDLAHYYTQHSWLTVESVLPSWGVLNNTLQIMAGYLHNDFHDGTVSIDRRDRNYLHNVHGALINVRGQLTNVVSELNIAMNRPEDLRALNGNRPEINNGQSQQLNTNQSLLQKELATINQAMQQQEAPFRRVYDSFQLIHNTIARRSNPTERAFNGFFRLYEQCYPVVPANTQTAAPTNNPANTQAPPVTQAGAVRNYSTMSHAFWNKSRVSSALPNIFREPKKPSVSISQPVSLFRSVFESRSLINVAQKGASILRALVR